MCASLSLSGIVLESLVALDRAGKTEMTNVVFADEQDDIASLRTKLEGVGDPKVAVVVPRGNRALVSPIAIRLLQRQAESMALDVSLVSADPVLRRIAREEGLRVFGSARAYQRTVERQPGALDHARVALGEALAHASSVATTAAVLAVVALAVGLVYVFLPSATVTVAPRAEVISAKVPVVADPGAQTVDLEAGRIPARVVYLLVEASDQMPTREGRTSDDERAVGIVTFVNRNAAETVVPKGTLVSTPEGIGFRTDAEVRLAPGLGNTGQTRVVAVNPGPSGNVPKERITRIEGLLASYVMLQNEEPTAGGGAQATPAVTADDQSRLETRVLEKAKEEALAKLATLPQGREMLVKESLEFTPLEVSFDHSVGQEAKTLGVQIKARAAATIANQDDVEEVARHKWTPTPRPGFQIAPDGIRMLPPEVTKVEGRVVTLAASLEATTLAQINVARVQQYVRWRRPAEASAELSRIYDLARPTTIRIDPGWAERAYRVRVVVDTSAAQR